MSDEMLVPLDLYLASGIHIGTTQKTRDMERYIFRIRQDGLYILDINETNKKIEKVGKFLAKFEPEKILVVSSRIYGFKPVLAFGQKIGTKTITKRFIPGSLTNPNCEDFIEPEVVILTDPRADYQILREAGLAKIPVVALCDSENYLSNVDLVVPTNNKGKKALALVYYLIAREMLKAKGQIKDGEEPPFSIDDFKSKDEED